MQADADAEAEHYQSHQSGIETRYKGRRTGASPDYQSHQSGIETDKGRDLRHNRATTNRTNLELKPALVRVFFAIATLPIAPIWN